MEQQQVEMSPSRVWRFATAAGVSALFLVLDQITKAVVRNVLVLGAAGPELIPGVIRLVYVQNIGAAFPLARDWAVLSFCSPCWLSRPRFGISGELRSSRISRSWALRWSWAVPLATPSIV